MLISKTHRQNIIINNVINSTHKIPRDHAHKIPRDQCTQDHRRHNTNRSAIVDFTTTLFLLLDYSISQTSYQAMGLVHAFPLRVFKRETLGDRERATSAFTKICKLYNVCHVLRPIEEGKPRRVMVQEAFPRCQCYALGRAALTSFLGGCFI